MPLTPYSDIVFLFRLIINRFRRQHAVSHNPTCWVNGKIIDLDKGYTQIAAEYIREAIGGDLFRIEQVRTYSTDHMKMIQEAKEELQNDARPELKQYPESIDEYCPLKESFVRSGAHEYYYRMKYGLDVSGMPDTKQVRRNGIYYFAAWNALSFVYRDENIAPYHVTYLGEFPEEMSALLETAGSKVDISLEVSE